jgi:GTPase SAR1 family protein
MNGVPSIPDNAEHREGVLENTSAARDGLVWRQFLRYARECVIDADFKERRIQCSAALIQSFRLTRESLPHTIDQWLELYHPDDYDKTLEFRRLVFGSPGERETIFSLERRLYCGDGQYRWFRLNAFCLRDESGGSERLIGVETNLFPEESRGRERAASSFSAARGLEKRLAALETEKELLASRLSEERLSREATERRVSLLTQLLDASSDFLLRRVDSQLELEPEPESKPEPEPEQADEALPGVFDQLEQPDRLEKFEKVFSARLEGVLRGLSSVAALFPTRAAQIEALLHAAEEKADLEVGVVGITSSGKSTFINAVMGERLLPEETRATTNLMIRCRKGTERFVTVVSKDGTRERVSGADLTAEWMNGQSSEHMNPANEKGVALLEWSSPDSLLPEGLALIDTPGLDAYGFPEHSELVLRRLLPSLDIVLYITSIRNRLKAADLEALNAVLEQNQRIVFLLSQIDLEQDDTEGGRVVLSRRQKLSAYVRELREDIGKAHDASAQSAIAGAAILPVSSQLALAHFHDRDSAEWRSSNFEALVGQLEDFRAGLKRYGAELRVRRAAALLSRLARDLRLSLDKCAGAEGDGQFEKAEEKLKEKIRDLRDAQLWVNAEVSAVRNEWRRLLDPEYHLKYLEKELERANTVKGVKDRYERWSVSCSDLTVQMTARMDRARRSCREILLKHGVVPGSREWSLPETGKSAADTQSGLPFHRYIFQRPQEIQVRGWFESIWFWPSRRMFFRQDIDKNLMLEDARELLSERLRLLNGHLSWWENKMKEDCCDPLFRELSREEAALTDAGRAAEEQADSRSALLDALAAAQESESAIKAALSDFFAPEPKNPVAPEKSPEKALEKSLEESLEENLEESLEETFFGGPEKLDKKNEDELAGKELARKALAREEEENFFFAPLLTTFREQDIQSRFLRLDALRDSRRVVLLGLRRHDSLRLLSRLAHDAAFSDSLRAEDGREIGERDWIFCGSTPPALPHVHVPAPDTLLRELEVLVAPSDTLLCGEEPEGGPSIDWNDLFAEWLPVIHLDIARVDSGLSDLARAPYVRALPHARHWIAASGQGALFNARLSDLLTDVPDRVDLFSWRRDCKGRAEWFVYENYDARYTDFMLWGRKAIEQSREQAMEQLMEQSNMNGRFGDSLLRKWTESGYDFTFPFSEDRMRLALERARTRKA